MSTFIQQGCIQLVKIDSKDIYNVKKGFCFKQMLFFLVIKESWPNIINRNVSWAPIHHIRTK